MCKGHSSTWGSCWITMSCIMMRLSVGMLRTLFSMLRIWVMFAVHFVNTML